MTKLWTELESFLEKGYVKSIGVSNFNVQGLLEIINNCKVIPAVNEVELNPYLTQQDLLAFCKLYGIQIIGYNSFVSGAYIKDYESFKIFDEEIIIKLAEKYQKSKGQILLNWGLSKGAVVIAKSNSVERMKENMDSQSFKLEEEDVAQISKLNANKRFCLNDYQDNGTFNFNIFG